MWKFLLFVLFFATAPTLSLAGEAPPPAAVDTQSVDAAPAAAEAAAQPCPGDADGKCCGACQQRARLSKKPAAEMGGCPCQRARQAREDGEAHKGNP